jgi:hypothetical protein
VRAHVPAVGEQRHRVGEKAGNNLDDHHHAGDRDHDPCPALAFGKIVHEIVRMAKVGMICLLHL